MREPWRRPCPSPEAPEAEEELRLACFFLPLRLLWLLRLLGFFWRRQLPLRAWTPEVTAEAAPVTALEIRPAELKSKARKKNQ